VLCGDDQVAHPRLFDQARPLVGVELDGVERGNDTLFVFGQRNLLNAHQVLGISAKWLAIPRSARARIHPPMHEATEPRLAPPGQPLVAAWLRRLPPSLLSLAYRGLIARRNITTYRRSSLHRPRLVSRRAKNSAWHRSEGLTNNGGDGQDRDDQNCLHPWSPRRPLECGDSSPLLLLGPNINLTGFDIAH